MTATVLLSRRESEALTLLGRFRFLTRPQVQRFLFAGNRRVTEASQEVMAKRVLHSLSVKGLVRHTARARGGPGGGSTACAYYLTKAGARALAESGLPLPRRTIPKGTFLLRHALTSAEVALCFLETAAAHPGHALAAYECDRQAAQRLNGHLLVPDAYLVYTTAEVELHCFLEIDLATAGTTFFRRKIERYLDLYRSRRWQNTLGLWPSVRVIAPSEQRVALLKRATEATLKAQPDRSQLRDATEFAFTALPQLLKHSPLAPIWQVADRTGTHTLLPHP